MKERSGIKRSRLRLRVAAFSTAMGMQSRYVAGLSRRRGRALAK